MNESLLLFLVEIKPKMAINESHAEAAERQMRTLASAIVDLNSFGPATVQVLRLQSNQVLVNADDLLKLQRKAGGE